MMPENSEEPLSFRVRGWFKCPLPTLDRVVFIKKHLNADAIVLKYIQYTRKYQKDYDPKKFIMALEYHPEQMKKRG